MIIMLLGLLWPLLYAIILMSLSTMMVSNDPFIIQLVIYSAACLISLRGIYYIILSLTNKNKVSIGTIIQTFLEMLLSAVLVFLPNFSYFTFVILYEIYLTFYITIKLSDTFIYNQNKLYKSMIPSLCQAVFFIQVFFAIIFMPEDIRKRVLEISCGISFSLFGIAHLCDFISIVTRNKKARNIFNSIRLTMPDLSA